MRKRCRTCDRWRVIARWMNKAPCDLLKVTKKADDYCLGHLQADEETIKARGIEE